MWKPSFKGIQLPFKGYLKADKNPDQFENVNTRQFKVSMLNRVTMFWFPKKMKQG